jgi:hypothetical protein
MELTNKQIKHISKYLEYGDKQRLATFLEVTPQTISRYLSTRKMPRLKFDLTTSFINSLQNETV